MYERKTNLRKARKFGESKCERERKSRGGWQVQNIIVYCDIASCNYGNLWKVRCQPNSTKNGVRPDKSGSQTAAATTFTLTPDRLLFSDTFEENIWHFACNVMAFAMPYKDIPCACSQFTRAQVCTTFNPHKKDTQRHGDQLIFVGCCYS